MVLETGMRRGEILELRWREVSGMMIDDATVTWAPRAEIVLSAEKTKTRTLGGFLVSAPQGDH